MPTSNIISIDTDVQPKDSSKVSRNNTIMNDSRKCQSTYEAQLITEQTGKYIVDMKDNNCYDNLINV